MSTGYADIASTISQLKALNTAELEDKLTIFVKELNSWVTYDSSSNLASDDITVISPSSGVGRWKVTNILSTSYLFKSFQTSENISALRAVIPNLNNQLRYATQATDSTILGISRNAGTTGNLVQVVTSGLLTDSSWNWTVNKYIFLGSNGILTQSVPASGYLVFLGTAVSPTSFNLNISNSILLS